MHSVPSTFKTSKGKVVTWMNLDSDLHTVTSGSPNGGNSGIVFDSSYITSGKEYTLKFSKSGKYNYYCTLHPFMKGKIIVK